MDSTGYLGFAIIPVLRHARDKTPTRIRKGRMPYVLTEFLDSGSRNPGLDPGLPGMTFELYCET